MQKTQQVPLSVYGGHGRENVANYQSTECIIYGSIFNSQKAQMIERLKGLCDPGGPISFFEHNMVFKLSMPINHFNN